MYNIVLFTKTSDFYINIIENFLLNFNIEVIVINKKYSLNKKYFDYLNSKNIKFIVHPFKKQELETNLFITKLKKFHIDYIFTIFYPQILSKKIIDLSKINSYNFHPGRLPNQRGAHILNWLLINNVKNSVVTVHKLEEDIDSGDILLEEKYEIRFNDTIINLIQKTNIIACNIVKKLKNILGKNEYLYRNDGIDKYYNTRNINDSIIDINKLSMLEIYNINRALIYPYPGIIWIKNNKKFTNNKFLSMEELKNLIFKQ